MAIAGRQASMAVVCVPSLALLALICLSGCASGSFSTPNAPPSTGTTPTLPANASSLPPLTSPLAVNDYVGAQTPGPSATTGENTVAHHIDQTKVSYTYDTVPIPKAETGPVPNSSGLIVPWYGFWDLGDTSGVAGLPGPQHYGLTLEEPSRFAFFISNSGAQISAMVPKQTTACVTPTGSAQYEFLTLFGANFNPATDAAYGTVQLAPNFAFSGASQFTTGNTAATTGLIPFAAGACIQSSAAPGLGYFIDTPAAPNTANIEVRSFLGPTGILVSNLQDASGDPLPGVLGMVQPGSAISVSDLVASTVVYSALEYQPLGSPAAQYGYFGSNDQTLLGNGNEITSAGFTGLQGGFQNASNPTSSPAAYSFAFVFNTQDASHPGLFPKAQFVYYVAASDPSVSAACPGETVVYPGGAANGSYILCASPAVALAGQHDGKYVVMVSGINVLNNNSPTLLILVQQ